MSRRVDSDPTINRVSVNQSRHAYEFIRSLIRSGRIANNDVLVERVLVKSLDLPRTSIRQALSRLAAEGLVSRQRHVGTRVSHNFYQLPIDDILPWRTPPGFMYRKINDRRIPSIPVVRERLETNDPVVGIIEQIFEHVTADGSVPIGVRTAYYRAQHTQPDSWPTCPSLPYAFQYVFGVALGEVQTVVDAVVCDPETASLLHIAPGVPLLMREQTLRDVDGVVQEYSFSHYRADRVSFPLTKSYSAHLWADQGQQAPTPDVLPYRARRMVS